jgi:Secretion system C-terminal sorting domain
MKTKQIFLLSLLCVFKISAQSGFFDLNWKAKTFIIPATTTPVALPTNGSVTAIVTLAVQDTLGKVLPTQLGTNTTFRSNNANSKISNRIGLYKSSGMGTYRYPAGSGSNTFFWDGVAPTNPLQYKANDGTTHSVNPIIGTNSNTLTPALFAEFKKTLNCEANVTVNYFYARYGTTPEDSRPGATTASKRAARVKQAADYAAAFVKYMNIDLKANVKYWEVGNECYGNWEEGYNINGSIVTGTEYGEDFNVFAAAMKAVDPTIKIGAVVFSGSGVNEKNWSSGVLQQVKNTADFLIMHEYFARTGTAQDVMNSAGSLGDDVSIMKDWVVQYAGKTRNYFPIALTEFNTQNQLHSTNMANGLFFTQMIGEIIKNQIGLSTSWVNEWNGGGTIPEVNTHGLITINDPRQATYTPRSTFFPYYFYSKYFGSHILNATSNKSNVKVYASGYKDKELGIVLVNSGATEELVNLNIDAAKYNTAYWHEMYALNVNSENSKFYINGQTSTTIGGGPVDFESVAAYESAYKANSLVKLKPYSSTYLAFVQKSSLAKENVQKIQNSVKVYPNPTKDGVFHLTQTCNWRVYSILGIELKSGHSNQVDLSEQPKGTFLVKVSADGSTVTLKVIKN